MRFFYMNSLSSLWEEERNRLFIVLADWEGGWILVCWSREMGVGLQVWKLGLEWAEDLFAKDKGEGLRGRGDEGTDLGGRESGTKTEQGEGWERVGSWELRGREERLGNCISQGFRSKCCAQCIVRKPSVKGTLFTDAFMGVDYFQCVHRRDDFCLKVAPSLWWKQEMRASRVSRCMGYVSFILKRRKLGGPWVDQPGDQWNWGSTWTLWTPRPGYLCSTLSVWSHHLSPSMSPGNLPVYLRLGAVNSSACTTVKNHILKYCWGAN